MCHSQTNAITEICIREHLGVYGVTNYELNFINDSVNIHFVRGKKIDIQQTLPIFHHKPINDFINRIDGLKSNYVYKTIVDAWHLNCKIYYINNSIKEIDIKNLSNQNSLTDSELKYFLNLLAELKRYDCYNSNGTVGVYNYLSVEGLKENYTLKEAIQYEIYNHSYKNFVLSKFEFYKITAKGTEEVPVEELHKADCPVVSLLKSVYSDSILLKSCERKPFVWSFWEICKCHKVKNKIKGTFMFKFEVKDLKNKRLSIYTSNFLTFE
jgi:hypothetical protein